MVLVNLVNTSWILQFEWKKSIELIELSTGSDVTYLFLGSDWLHMYLHSSYLTPPPPSPPHDLVFLLLNVCPYPKVLAITLTAFADVTNEGCQDTRRSTSDSMQLLGDRLPNHSRQDITHMTSSLFKEHVENEVVELYLPEQSYQLADIFTSRWARREPTWNFSS
ncbi:hypothetical protein Tco_0017308 [Tanacetum coccineum]